ncbi:hypothetical protein [Litchfieldia alkalitelluris]|uniref:hypothetical protein n=1 Tax=Litchfieldia alkalitelluris TaxID=304268 RepID=UPI000996F96A|nr:hypothetical protein [Litchfieldia alkalitelluris]
METQFITEIFNKLRDRELNEYRVTKEHFLSFRKVLVEREDFKQFRGIAQHGGEVIYQYLDEPRS